MARRSIDSIDISGEVSAADTRRINEYLAEELARHGDFSLQEYLAKEAPLAKPEAKIHGWPKGSKLCTSCRKLRTPDDFGPDTRNRDGRKSVCKFCIRVASKDYRIKRIVEGKPAPKRPFPIPRMVPERVVTEKECTKCSQLRSAGDFGPDPRNLDGLKSHCNQCNKIAAKGSYQTRRVRRGFRLLHAMAACLD